MPLNLSWALENYMRYQDRQNNQGKIKRNLIPKDEVGICYLIW